MKVLFFLLCMLSVAQGAPKYGPHATPLSKKYTYLQKNQAPDYWAMSPYYVGQENDSACSAASLVMVLNAARKSADLNADQELVSQKILTEKLTDPQYKYNVCGNPALALSNGVDRLGVSVRRLEDVLIQALKHLKIKYEKVEVVEIDFQNLKTSEKKLEEILNLNEKSNSDFVILNFTQGVLTGDDSGMIGHIAPVAAYNSTDKQVLILDPDRKWYEPYWAPLKEVFKAVSDKRSDKKPGYIYLKLK